MARDLYATGQVNHERFERLLERELLLMERIHGRVFIPDGWDPLPPCEHLWIEVTCFGDRFPRLLCGLCGVTRVDALGHDQVPESSTEGEAA